jgi:hypothetical protein
MERDMKFDPFATGLVLALMFAGCTRGPGVNDVQSRAFCTGRLISFRHRSLSGALAPTNQVMFFDRSTVIRIHGTYLIIGAPCCVLLAGLVVLVVLPVLVSRFRKRRKREQ